MRTIGVVTVGRSDYGIYVPVLRAIEASPDLQLRLLVSGAHLSPEFGRGVDGIVSDGFAIAERVEMLLSSDSAEGVGKSIGLGVIGFAQVYARTPLDMLLVLGDRFEMYSAALAALPFRLPVAHIHGGELTEGAIDDALRHSLTKLSHLHFVATDRYARRVEQLGEESWRVVVAGAPALDQLRMTPLLPAADLERAYGIRLDPPPLLVTFHPVTLDQDGGEGEVRELLAALAGLAQPVVFTQPNADAGGRRISGLIDEFVHTHPYARRIDSLGTRGYFSLMHHAAAMVGNSSSGIIEAPSFGLPVVNVGDRQAGRARGGNVIDVAGDCAQIQAGITRALDPEFRRAAAALPNPFGDGHAAGRIVDRLRTVPLDHRLLVKRFADQPLAAVTR